MNDLDAIRIIGEQTGQNQSDHHEQSGRMINETFRLDDYFIKTNSPDRGTCSRLRNWASPHR